MKAPQSVVYKGCKYRLQSTGTHYRSWPKDPNQEASLHRFIWIEHNGPIPEGMVIHHKDGDWQNNNIENLEMMPRGKHQSLHVTEKMSDQDHFKKMYEWHRSLKGRKWFKGQGKRSWKGRKPLPVKCSICGGKYKTFFPSRSRFCSSTCQAREYRRKCATAHGECASCGKGFVFNKYKAQVCCSRSCATRYRFSLRP